jgi:hypothetical protein
MRDRRLLATAVAAGAMCVVVALIGTRLGDLVVPAVGIGLLAASRGLVRIA